jgi:hypothetical protein
MAKNLIFLLNGFLNVIYGSITPSLRKVFEMCVMKRTGTMHNAGCPMVNQTTKNMKLKTTILSAAALSAVTGSSFGALVLTNGGFETNGAAVGNASLFRPSGWVAEEVVTFGGIQNSTNLNTGSGVDEGITAAQATGSQHLRLVGDVGLDGGVNQDLGSADAGTYVITGDYFTGGNAGPVIGYAPTIEFYTGDPLGAGTLLATATLAGGALDGATNNSSTFSVSTGALAGGENIWVRMRTNPTLAGEVTRGGVDNLQLAFAPVPEPSSTALLGLGGLALILRRRK